MDVTLILESDHRGIEQLIGNIRGHEGSARSPFIAGLADGLRTHMELEETVLYGVIKEVMGDEAMKGAATEHELGRKALADVMRLAPDEPGFSAALDALEAGLNHHIAQEESDVFPALRASRAAQVAMAEPFMKKRSELSMDQ